MREIEIEFLTDKKLEKRKLNFGIFCNNRFYPTLY